MAIEMIEEFDQGTQIKVIGVGGGGGNAVEHMIGQGVQGVQFVCANTDAQALNRSGAGHLVQLGSSGLAVGGVSGGVAGGSLGVMVETVTQDPAALAGVAAGVLGGMLGYALTWWYLASFHQSAQQRQQLRRFMWLNAGSGATWVFCLMLATVLFSQWQVIIAVLAIGLGVINYQYLVSLPRIMDPILAHPANAGRRRGYDYVLGGKAVLLSSLLAIGALLYVMAKRGLI